jgi:L-asparaginase
VKQNQLAVFVTGGTFDKEYNELTGALFFKETHVGDMLHLGRCQLSVTLEKLMMIDSLDMTNAHRVEIVNSCRKSKSKQIVITHGTDTMQQTALGMAELNKTIVLTGAMVPYKFGSSDGMFNLGCALAFAQVLPAGVYIAMNGKYFLWSDVRKNKERGIFEPVTKGDS